MKRISSMTKSINPRRYKTSIKMSSNPPVVLVYVEGDSDVIAYQTLFKDLEDVTFKPVRGFSKVIKEVTSETRDLKDTNIKAVFGIIDADFTHLTGKKRTKDERIFVTDEHDIETMFLRVFQYLDTSKEIENETKVRSYKVAEDLSYRIGIYRYMNYNEFLPRFGVRFSRRSNIPLPYEKMESGIYGNDEMCLNEVVDLYSDSSYKDENKPKIKKEYYKIKLEELDKYQVINGHDLLAFYMNIYSSKSSSYDCKDPEEFWDEVIKAADTERLQKTKLYCDLSTQILAS